ncbi:uncharacterized protein LOC110983903 [Acanthaster planci]|uniref:Uncharacterized protein LOC110983903 n=1 Tax=Acanthaster planci TaxID=133434 RepID=A0A8B7Z7G9_ACAPL|nr:uncharacterized protein LOC110983903 [Acanthaster planci]
MFRTLVVVLLATVAVSVFGKDYPVSKDCNDDPAGCKICVQTYQFMKDSLMNAAFVRTNIEYCKLCTCPFVPKGQPEHGACVDHFNEIYGHVKLFVSMYLDDTRKYCGYICPSARNSSLPSCQPKAVQLREGDTCVLNEDGPVCGVCTGTVVWLKEMLLNKQLIMTADVYLNFYCDLAASPCVRQICRQYVREMNKLAMALGTVLDAKSVCQPMCSSSVTVHTPNLAGAIADFLRHVTEVMDVVAGK